MYGHLAGQQQLEQQSRHPPQPQHPFQPPAQSQPPQQQAQQQAHQQAQHQEKPDIYAILSADDPLDIDENTPIDTDALVMDIFDTQLSASTTPNDSSSNIFDLHPLAKPMSSHSTVPSSNSFKFNPGFLNTDMMPSNSNDNNPFTSYQLQANQQIQPNTRLQNDSSMFAYTNNNTLLSSFRSFETPNVQMDRRHSVAVSGGMTDFNLRLLQSYHPPASMQQMNYNNNRRRSMMELNDTNKTPQTFMDHPSSLLPTTNTFKPSHTQLSTVIENETPLNIAHRASMPNIFLSQESRLQINNLAHRVNSISARTSPMSTPPSVNMQLNANTYCPPLSREEPAFVGRKRLHPQQFDQDNRLYPLPMSGISSRKQSVTTPQDISAWNRMVNSKKPKVHSESSLPTLAEKEQTEPETAEGGKEEGYPLVTKADLDAVNKDPTAIPRRQKLRFDGDEYTPKWVRYVGQSKEGYCDTCQPGKWLQLKNSAFWYHKQFFHGISSVSGKPFASPLDQRAGEHDIIEGLCHQCREYVPICNSKRKNSVLWYRHAHKCHVYDKPKTIKSNNNDKRNSISVASKDCQLNQHLQENILI